MYKYTYIKKEKIKIYNINIQMKQYILLQIVQQYYTKVESSILGIDQSSEYIKVAAVKPGNPFHIVVDEQSKRKIPLAIAFDDKQRYFGNNAINFLIRKPKDTQQQYHRQQGQEIESSNVKDLKEFLPHNYVKQKDRGNAVGIHVPSKNETYSPEEQIAMIQRYILKIASDEGINTKDVVLTVPVWFTPLERKCQLDASDIAGIHVQGQIHDTTAAGQLYGIENKQKDKKTINRVQLINSGSTGTSISMQEYKLEQEKDSNKTQNIGNVIINSWDKNLGGINFDRILQNEMLNEFIEKYKDKSYGVENNPKSMIKLLKQSTSSKIIQSANKDTIVKIENLYNDIDFNYIITRDKFYSLSDNQQNNYKKIVERILYLSNKTREQIDSAIIIGGTVRIPGVQDKQREVLNRDRQDQNLNGDESMAMGAVFYAASQSPQFHVQQFTIIENSNYDIYALLIPYKDNGINIQLYDTQQIKVFSQGQPLGKRKKIHFWDMSDQIVQLQYVTSSYGSDSVSEYVPFELYSIEGIDKVINELHANATNATNATTTNATTTNTNNITTTATNNTVQDVEENKKLHITILFQYDTSGIARAYNAIVKVEHEEEVINPNFQSLLKEYTTYFVKNGENLNATRSKEEKILNEQTAQSTILSKETINIDEQKLKWKNDNDIQIDTLYDYNKYQLDNVTINDKIILNNYKKDIELGINDTKKKLEEIEEKINENIKNFNNQSTYNYLLPLEEDKNNKDIKINKMIKRIINRDINLKIRHIYGNEENDRQLEAQRQNNDKIKQNNFCYQNDKQKLESQNRQNIQDEQDIEQKNRAYAYNKLESHIYTIKNEQNYDENFIYILKDDEKSILNKEQNELEIWQYEQDSKTNSKEFINKYKEQDSKFQRYLQRKNEYLYQEKTIQDSKEFVEKMVTHLKQLLNEKKWLEKDIQDIQTKLTDFQQWLTDSMDKQSKLKPTDDPILLSSDIVERITYINNDFIALGKKKPPRTKKPSKNGDAKKETADTTNTTETVATDTEAVDVAATDKEVSDTTDTTNESNTLNSTVQDKSSDLPSNETSADSKPPEHDEL